MILGLRTVIYHVGDLARAKAWYRNFLDVAPYFDQPYYVGFNVGGFELGLDPDTSLAPSGPGGVVAYWGVANIEQAVARAQTLDGGVTRQVLLAGGKQVRLIQLERLLQRVREGVGGS